MQEDGEAIVDVERLRSLPLFGELDHHDLAIVARHVREASAAAGEVLFQEGTIPYELLVIEEGTAEIVKDGRTIGSIGPGDVRIALRYFPRNFARGFFGLLHEIGHALYDQGLDPAHYGTPMGDAASLGLH